MKTFKWTVPQWGLSEVEQSQVYPKPVGEAPDAPSVRELKEHAHWEKVRQRGLRAYFWKTAAALSGVIAVFYSLHAFFGTDISITALLGSLLGTLLGLYTSWNRYKDNRGRVQRYLAEQEAEVTFVEDVIYGNESG